jgi:hypothetical protein
MLSHCLTLNSYAWICTTYSTTSVKETTRTLWRRHQPTRPQDPHWRQLLRPSQRCRNFTLRITDSKIHRCGTDADLDITDMQLRRIGNGSQRYRFQATADTLIQYLHKQGSKLKVLAFSPLDYFGKPHDPDVNGHYWPHYHYYKATFTDGLGINTAVARPLRNWKVDFPEPWVLNEFDYEWEEEMVVREDILGSNLTLQEMRL